MVYDFNYIQAEIKNMNMENLLKKAYETMGRLYYDCNIYDHMDEDELDEIKDSIMSSIQELEHQQKTRKKLEELLFTVYKEPNNE